MQFATYDHNVPEALLQAHEGGRVVFFCGVSISRPAGLPDFGGLVQRLFQQTREPADEAESDLVGQSKFDRAIKSGQQ